VTSRAHVFHYRYRTFPRYCRESANLARLSTVVTLVGSGFAMWMRMRVMGLRWKLGALNAAACLDHRGGTSTRHKTTAGRYLQPHTMTVLSR
jgi:hypothetical protein